MVVIGFIVSHSLLTTSVGLAALIPQLILRRFRPVFIVLPKNWTVEISKIN